MTRGLSILVWLCVPVHVAVAGGQPRVDDVLAAMEASGPNSLPALYFDCSTGSAYDAIATGNAEWTKLAVRAQPAADGCVGESLADALGRAMQRHPENVLPWVGKTPALAPERICLPFVSDEVSVAVQRRAVTASRRAIERAKHFETQKAACLRFIGTVEERIGR